MKKREHLADHKRSCTLSHTRITRAHVHTRTYICRSSPPPTQHFSQVSVPPSSKSGLRHGVFCERGALLSHLRHALRFGEQRIRALLLGRGLQGSHVFRLPLESCVSRQRAGEDVSPLPPRGSRILVCLLPDPQVRVDTAGQRRTGGGRVGPRQEESGNREGGGGAGDDPFERLVLMGHRNEGFRCSDAVFLDPAPRPRRRCEHPARARGAQSQPAASKN